MIDITGVAIRNTLGRQLRNVKPILFCTCGSTKTFPWGKGDHPKGVVDEGLTQYEFA